MTLNSLKNIGHILLLWLVISPCYGGILVAVVNETNGSSLTKDEISRVFLGKSKSFSNGVRSKPVVLDNDKAVHEEFVRKVLNRSVQQFNSYWAKQLFTGKGKPPQSVDSVNELLGMVARDNQLIGYMTVDSLDVYIEGVLLIPIE